VKGGIVRKNGLEVGLKGRQGGFVNPIRILRKAAGGPRGRDGKAEAKAESLLGGSGG